MLHTIIEKEDMAMNENEREFFTLVDEDGSEIEFEKIGEITLNEKVYFAMIPAEAAENAQNEGGFCEYVVLRLEKDADGEDTLVSVDDDDEFDNVADVFDDMFSEEIDYDGN